MQGGNRIGIVGSGVFNEKNNIINLNYISSLNFRISRQVLGCSNSIMTEIWNSQKDNIYNTLIASAPGIGKTTLLKDITRNISNGRCKRRGLSVSVIDERGEIAATHKGMMQNDLGIRTDVLDNIPKFIGMKMAIRSMAPDVIVADEIGGKEDVEAIKYALRCGVKGIFTAHATSIEELKKNPAISSLIEEKVFEKIIILKNRNGNNFDKVIY